MILQTTDLSRLLIIFVVHLFISILWISLAIKMLRRNINHLTTRLSTFYITNAIGLLLTILYLPFNTIFLGYIIYLASVYLILFGFIFLVFFVINLTKLDFNVNLRRQYIIIIIYALIIIILLNFPGGITFNEKTNWRPKYSWIFVLLIYIFFTISIFIPTIFYSIKLQKSIHNEELKKRFKFFIIGIIGMFTMMYGVTLYNTWSLLLFNSIWSIIVYFIVFPSGYLIYYGIGHEI